jgi:hypothetical protein
MMNETVMVGSPLLDTERGKNRRAICGINVAV